MPAPDTGNDGDVKSGGRLKILLLFLLVGGGIAILFGPVNIIVPTTRNLATDVGLSRDMAVQEQTKTNKQKNDDNVPDTRDHAQQRRTHHQARFEDDVYLCCNQFSATREFDLRCCT